MTTLKRNREKIHVLRLFQRRYLKVRRRKTYVSFVKDIAMSEISLLMSMHDIKQNLL